MNRQKAQIKAQKKNETPKQLLKVVSQEQNVTIKKHIS